MKLWILACAALMVAGSAFGIGRAQTQADQVPPGGPAGVREACAADIEKLCSDAATAGHHVFQCLREQQDGLSGGCKSALSSARAHWRHDSSSDGGSPGGPPASTDAPPPGGAPAHP